MNTREAVALIRRAIPQHTRIWADVGAGDGTFTRALVTLLGPGSRIYAVDRAPRALTALDRWAAASKADVTTVEADFTRPFELPGLDDRLLDGLLLANALHFVRDPETVLARLAARVRPGGRVVIIEYDRRKANPWVPYPLPRERLPELAAAARLSPPEITATRPSAFQGLLYVAACDRREDAHHFSSAVGP